MYKYKQGYVVSELSEGEKINLYEETKEAYKLWKKEVEQDKREFDLELARAFEKEIEEFSNTCK